MRLFFKAAFVTASLASFAMPLAAEVSGPEDFPNTMVIRVHQDTGEATVFNVNASNRVTDETSATDANAVIDEGEGVVISHQGDTKSLPPDSASLAAAVDAKVAQATPNYDRYDRNRWRYARAYNRNYGWYGYGRSSYYGYYGNYYPRYGYYYYGSYYPYYASRYYYRSYPYNYYYYYNPYYRW